MTAPRASWVVPVFNGEHYLEAALASISAQTFEDFEAIVIDDGSTDGSPAIMDAAAERDARFRVVRKANTGLVDTLNLGLKLARGPLCVRFDADDICLPQRLERQVAFMDAHPECVAVGSRTVIIDAAGQEVRRTRGGRWQDPVVNGFPTGGISLCHPSVTMRTQAALDAGGYSEAYHAAEDYDLWFRLSERGVVCEMPEHLLYYRVHSGSVSAVKVEQQRLSCVKAEITAFLRQQGVDAASIAELETIASPAILFEQAFRLCPALPRPELLQLYFDYELLRRLLYRSSGDTAWRTALRVAGEVAALAPRFGRAAERRIAKRAVVELLRYGAVNATGRNRSRGRAPSIDP